MKKYVQRAKEAMFIFVICSFLVLQIMVFYLVLQNQEFITTTQATINNIEYDMKKQADHNFVQSEKYIAMQREIEDSRDALFEECDYGCRYTADSVRDFSSSTYADFVYDQCVIRNCKPLKEVES